MAAMLQRLAPRLAPCRRSAARCFSSSSSGSSPSSGSSSSSGSPSPPDAAGSTTHFGFQQVREEDKQPMVASVFHKVAERYDVMNDFMSGGMHRVWKDSFVDTLHPVGPLRVLDVAGGTGDIAFRIAERLSTGRNAASAQDSEIVICDINSSMLQVGRERAEKQLPPARAAMFQWVEGNAEQLAFPDNSFDVYTIAFGIRNVTHVDRALAEAFRVLRPGGRFLCMEFSQVPNPLIRAVYDAVRLPSDLAFSLARSLASVVTNAPRCACHSTRST
jgi:2-methoxy-6-polyprenyl-1,4-benzoquinol methylase